MVIRPVVIAVICVGFFIILESLMVPKAMALRTKGFRIEDQRPQKRRNYMLQRSRNKEILRGLEKKGVSYEEMESLDAISRIPEELAYIVDYGNTFDDEFFLDKSVQTRTRERGNIKLEKKYADQAIPDPPCSCKYNEDVKFLGETTFPRSVLTRNCDNTAQQTSCPFPYICQEIIYPIAILRKKSKRPEDYTTVAEDFNMIPKNLNISWNAEYRNVSVGCQCTNKFKRTDVN